MNGLLVIDMQEEYVGTKRNKKRYPYDTQSLISKINERIRQYPEESVIYIVNKFFGEIGKTPKVYVNGLDIVSRNSYMKRKSSAFSDVKLLEYLQRMNITSLELVGVDGNYCVAKTALDGIKKGFDIKCNEHCIGICNQAKFTRTRMTLLKKGVQFI